MLLNENQLYDNLSQIEVGDIFTIVLVNGDQKHSVVEAINNNEILLRMRGTSGDNDSGNTFSIHTNTAIEDGKILFRMNGSKAQSKTTFTRIIVSDSERKPKFTVTSEEDPEEIDAKEREAEKNKNILKNAREWRTELISNISELGIFDEVKFSYAQPEGFDEDGEIIFKDGTEGILHLEVEDIEGKLLYNFSVINTSGYLGNLLNKYKKETLSIYIGSSTFNTTPEHVNYATIQIFPHSDPKKPILLGHVYAFDGDESDDEEVEDKVSVEDMMKDKDLRRIMHKQNAWDTFLGREPVGVSPLDNLKNKKPLSTLFGFDKKRGQKVHFIWSGDDIKGGNLELRNNTEYRGYMYDNKTIKISGGKNSPENIMIAVGKMTKDSYHTATVTKRDANKKISEPVRGKIQIIK